MLCILAANAVDTLTMVRSVHTCEQVYRKGPASNSSCLSCWGVGLEAARVLAPAAADVSCCLRRGLQAASAGSAAAPARRATPGCAGSSSDWQFCMLQYDCMCMSCMHDGAAAQLMALPCHQPDPIAVTCAGEREQLDQRLQHGEPAERRITDECTMTPKRGGSRSVGGSWAAHDHDASPDMMTDCTTVSSDSSSGGSSSKLSSVCGSEFAAHVSNGDAVASVSPPRCLQPHNSQRHLFKPSGEPRLWRATPAPGTPAAG